MAKMYPAPLPDSILQDARRAAEVRTYEAFRDQLGKGWVVFYSCAWLGRPGPGAAARDGEIDFIVAHPERGALLIEVKGGGIRYDPDRGKWFSLDRAGQEHPIDPFNQLRASKAALVEKFRSLPRWKERWVSLGHAVAFPDTQVRGTHLPLEAPVEVILDGMDLGNSAARLDRIMSYWHERQTGPQPDGQDLIQQLIELLAPQTELKNHLALAVIEDDRAMLKLTNPQIKTLDHIRLKRRAAIAGCAGSGKTLLAIEKAKRLARDGYKTLLTCFNIPLAEHLSAATQGTPNLQVYNFHLYCEGMAREAGLPVPDAAGNSDPSKVFETYPDLLTQAIALRPDLKVDAIVVDEGQDFDWTWWAALDDCIANPEAAVFYIFYDDNQALYREGHAIPIETAIALDTNIRCTQTIHRESLKFYSGDTIPESGGPPGRPIERISYSDDRQLEKRLGEVLQRLVGPEGLATSDIVVLTPHGVSRSKLANAELSCGFRLTEQPVGKGQIELRSIYRFKGLERSVVIVAELDEAFLRRKVHWPGLLYVAFSRAKSHLVLLGVESVLAEINQAPSLN